MAGVDGAPAHCAAQPVPVTAARGPGSAEETEAGQVGEPTPGAGRRGPGRGLRSSDNAPPNLTSRAVRGRPPAARKWRSHVRSGQRGVASPRLVYGPCLRWMFHLAGRAPHPRPAPLGASQKVLQEDSLPPRLACLRVRLPHGETKTQGESLAASQESPRKVPLPPDISTRLILALVGKGISLSRRPEASPAYGAAASRRGPAAPMLRGEGALAERLHEQR